MLYFVGLEVLGFLTVTCDGDCGGDCECDCDGDDDVLFDGSINEDD